MESVPFSLITGITNLIALPNSNNGRELQLFHVTRRIGKLGKGKPRSIYWNSQNEFWS